MCSSQIGRVWSCACPRMMANFRVCSLCQFKYCRQLSAPPRPQAHLRRVWEKAIVNRLVACSASQGGSADQSPTVASAQGIANLDELINSLMSCKSNEQVCSKSEFSARRPALLVLRHTSCAAECVRSVRRASERQVPCTSALSTFSPFTVWPDGGGKHHVFRSEAVAADCIAL
jgi:hypothetical protein